MSYDQPSNDFDAHEHGEDASSAAYDRERDLQNAIMTEIVISKRIRERDALLSELLEYFDDRADADYSDEAQRAIGNEEMHLAVRIRAVLGKGER